MNIRADLAELLHAGYSNAAIARQLNVAHETAAAARATLQIPNVRRGPKPTSTAEDLYWRRVQPTDGGHLLWTGHRNRKGVPTLRHEGREHTAYRVAFRIRYQRDPDGMVRAVCGRDGCVAPGCVEDRPMRERTAATFTAIFGEVS